MDHDAPVSETMRRWQSPGISLLQASDTPRPYGVRRR